MSEPPSQQLEMRHQRYHSNAISFAPNSKGLKFALNDYSELVLILLKLNNLANLFKLVLRYLSLWLIQAVIVNVIFRLDGMRYGLDS